MKKLIIVRHGEYFGESLSERGEADIEYLAARLRKVVGDGTPSILTSTALRAVESAEIIAKAFGTGYEEHEVLWSESSHPEDLPAALQLVRSKGEQADAVIVVTHLEYGEQLPDYFSTKVLGFSVPLGRIDKGEGLCIDCETKRARRV